MAATLLFQYLAISHNENLPTSVIYLQKASPQFCQILNSYSRKGQNLFRIMYKWRNFTKSGHTDDNFLFKEHLKWCLSVQTE